MAARKDKHQHHELAAKIITELRRYGLPHKHVSAFLGWLQDEEIVDLGGQGYSVNTLQRHYPLALKMGSAPSKHMLLQSLGDIAMGDFVPEGVSTDAAYRAALDALKWTLTNVHGVGKEPKGGPAGDTFPVELLGEVLDPDELLQLERIMVKLHNARKPDQALIEG